MVRPVPTNIILEMNKRGYKDMDILRYLKGKGYTPTEMSDAFNQAKVKLEIDRNQAAQESEESLEGEIEPAISHFPKIPVVQKQNPSGQDSGNSNFQIIQIKLRSLEEKQKQQLAYMENLRDQVIKKIQEDSSRMKEISAQVSALQHTFSKILEPLASNVKAKSGMLNLSESGREERDEPDSDEEKVVVIKETTKTVEKSKSRPKSKSTTSKKKKEKSSLDDQFK
jgi:hypothetical protein